MIPVILRVLQRRVVRNPPAPLRVLVLAAAILLYGSTGFLFFELPVKPDLTWADGFWYSFVTVTTVGYGDFYPSTPGGRFVVAVPLMFFGIGLLGYVLSIAASSLIEAKTKELHGMGTFKLKGHLVILNYPGIGKILRVLDELTADPSFGKHREIVLVDDDLVELPQELVVRGVHYVRGNPTRDETLTRASIDTARHAVVLTKRPGDPGSDDRNVAITLALEARAPDVQSVVECVDYTTEELLRKAGSDSVVCTSRFDAHFLGAELLNPGVQEVVEELTTNLRGQQIYLTRFSGESPRPYAKIAGECASLGHIVIGVRQGDSTRLNVEGTLDVAPGDHIISIGAERLTSLR